ncbi:hypothetical protein ACFV0V_37985, partial [Streptomyces bottropensis]
NTPSRHNHRVSMITGKLQPDTAAWLMNTPVLVDNRSTATELLAMATARFDAPPLTVRSDRTADVRRSL